MHHPNLYLIPFPSVTPHFACTFIFDEVMDVQKTKWTSSNPAPVIRSGTGTTTSSKGTKERRSGRTTSSGASRSSRSLSPLLPLVPLPTDAPSVEVVTHGMTATSSVVSGITTSPRPRPGVAVPILRIH